MSKFDFPQSAIDPAAAEDLTNSGSSPEPDGDAAVAADGPSTSQPGVELVPGIDISDMTVSEFLSVARPAPEWLPASTFAHITDSHELAHRLHGSFHLLDLNCPEIQGLIASTKGTFHGAWLARRLEPATAVGMPKPIKRKHSPKGKRPMLPNLFSLANELAAAQASDED